MFFTTKCLFLLVTFCHFLSHCKGAKNLTTSANFKCDEAVFERCVYTMLVNNDETFVYPTNIKELNATCK